MTRKVILYQGLPGSGKTHHAKQLQNQNPGQYKRVNKDDLRAMLDNGRFSRTNEDFVKDLRDHIIIKALEKGKIVLVDDTHLPLEKHYDRIKQAVREAGFDCPIEVDKSFLDVSLDECIRRDLLRPNSVGESVIRKMYNKHLKVEPSPPEYDPTLPDAIIIDVDGTLALMNGRSPYEYDKCDTDLPNWPVVETVNDLMEANRTRERRFLFVSGREDSVYRKTLGWLNDHLIAYPDGLYMRQEGDHRKDYVVKREIYESRIKSQYNVEFVIDDRKQVVDMWRSLGLTVFQVAEGDF